MITYEELYDFNKLLSNNLIKKIGIKQRSLSSLSPPSFNKNIKYLFIGMNPSHAEDKKGERKQESDSDKLLTLGKFKNNHNYKHFSSSSLNLTYPYFDGAWDIIDFDKEVKLFWQNEDQFKHIKKLSNIPIDKLEECANGDNKDDYVSFIDLLYVRETKQSNIKKAFKDDKIVEKISNFFDMQMDYYNPKFLIVINATVSHFLKEYVYEIKDDNLDSVYEDKKNNRIIFFGGMLRGQRCLDVFSRIRLKKEIEFYKNKVK